MKCLVIGRGGRCHAIIDALAKSKKVTQIFAAPGNDGMRNLATLVNIEETDVVKMLDFAKKEKIDLTIVGPEIALEAGMVDAFKEVGLKIFGPTASAAMIETSKEFAKSLMMKYKIPTASYRTFTDYLEALAYIKNQSFPIVIKYNGLASGKGVVIAHNLEEADKTLHEMLIEDFFGDSSVLVEEYLEGPEFSLMCLVNNEMVYPLPIAQDHKRAFDGDKGPNTGGMGAYSNVDIISQEDIEYAVENIMKKTASALVKEGVPFTGLLYGGLMKTCDGIKVIEFNARFGDPETEVILPRIKSDLYDVFCDIIDGNKIDLEISDDYTLGVVLASKGYPGKYEKSFLIENLDDLDVKVYHMGTKIKEGKFYTAGGRVLIVVASGKTLKEAQTKANEAASKIKCENLFFRHDIGYKSL